MQIDSVSLVCCVVCFYVSCTFDYVCHYMFLIVFVTKHVYKCCGACCQAHQVVEWLQPQGAERRLGLV